MWKTEDGELIFTTEPYHLDGDAIMELYDAILPLGLELDVMPKSGWYEGHTILVVISKPSRSRVIYNS